MAAEYGWTLDYIYYQVYYDDALFLIDKMNRRKTAHYKMLLAISHNPYSKEPDTLWSMLSRFERPEYLDTQLDKAQFAVLKDKLSKSGKFIVK